jgi:nitrite reductase/ring-hydroxylating ferredoxin subunit
MPRTWACARGDIAEGRGRTLRLQGLRVAVFRDQNRTYAIDAVCPHSGADLGEGRVQHGRVTCPEHGWTFDLATGCMPNMEEIAVRTYPVKIENEDVFVCLPVRGARASTRRRSGDAAVCDAVKGKGR